MQKILVTKVEKKPTAKGGTVVAIWDAAGTRFSGFKKELQAIEVGDTAEIEVEVKGDFNNINELKSLSKGTGPVAAAETAPYREDPDKRASIENEVAIQEIGRLMCARIPVPETARVAYWKWIAVKAGFLIQETGKYYIAPVSPAEPFHQKTVSEETVHEAMQKGQPIRAPLPDKDEITFPDPSASPPTSTTYEEATRPKMVTKEQMARMKDLKSKHSVSLSKIIREKNKDITAIDQLTYDEAETILKELEATVK